MFLVSFTSTNRALRSMFFASVASTSRELGVDVFLASFPSTNRESWSMFLASVNLTNRALA